MEIKNSCYLPFQITSRLKSISRLLILIGCIGFQCFGETAMASYPTDPTADLDWPSSSENSVNDIQMRFNTARANENVLLGLSLPMMSLPSQAEWDAMSDAEKAHWLINRERIDRGVDPLHGIESNVMSVAQEYAQYLMDNNAFSHSADGNSPWERLNINPAINNCHDFLNVAENLAVLWGGWTLPIERSVYMWMYDDSGSGWGHRHAILWYPYNDNSGPSGMEGFLGIGRASGTHNGWASSDIIVMNVFDPCPGWQYEPEDTQGFVLETGEVAVDEKWVFVAFTKTYVNPVVVTRTASLNGGDPGVVRVKNVSPNGFEVRFQEWDYRDGNHCYETLGYMVMEAGHHVLPNGIHVEAGTFESNSNSKILTFEDAFNQVPVVVSGVTTENEVDAVTGRLSNITTNSFGFRLQEQETDTWRHSTDETVAYIAWEPSSGEVDGMTYIVDSTFDEVTHNLYYIPFYPTFVNAPVFVADMQTMDGADTANVRWRNKNGEGIEVQIDEEQSKNSEVTHTTEMVGYLVFGSSAQ